MIELAKHIEILLLDNDCVIVPELGGFITHYQPARYEEDEGLFLPPLRTVGFNSQLTMNDGLLVQSYMQAYHTDFSDAVRIISEKVESLKETLHKEGIVEMQGIGVLHYTIYDTYEFLPNENGVLSPSLYALDAFAMSPLAMAEVVEEKAVADEQPVVTMKPKKEFRLNPQWLGNAVAVAVAAILFFVLSVPVENTYVERGVYASLGTDCLFDAIRTQSMATNLSAEVAEPQRKKTANIVPVAVKVEKVAPAPEPKEKTAEVKVANEVAKKEVIKKEAPVLAAAKKENHVKPEVKKAAEPEVKKAVPAPKKPAKPSKKYHIIVASLTTAQDAKRMLQEYKQQGYNDATVIESNGRFRISLCNQGDKAAAYNKLNDLKKNEAFKQAWMLTSK